VRKEKSADYKNGDGRKILNQICVGSVCVLKSQLKEYKVQSQNYTRHPKEFIELYFDKNLLSPYERTQNQNNQQGKSSYVEPRSGYQKRTYSFTCHKSYYNRVNSPEESGKKPARISDYFLFYR